jgi:peptide-methionine (S)-S-oxide reductase
MAVSGYAGGVVPSPTYELVSTGTTGHAEVVQVVFEPAFVSYEKLLEIFWRSHNPTTPNAQGPDSGPQYRSIILYHNEDQKKAAEKVYKALKARKVLKGQVVTQLVPFTGFYPAEAYHQDYYFNHPLDTYSMIYIAPKFDVYRKMGMLARQRPRKK